MNCSLEKVFDALLIANILTGGAVRIVGLIIDGGAAIGQSHVHGPTLQAHLSPTGTNGQAKAEACTFLDEHGWSCTTDSCIAT